MIRRGARWVEMPRPPGSKTERKEINLDTGKTRRLRPRRARGSVVNPRLAVSCPKYITENCERCDICGERSDQVSLGVTWADGEERIRAVSDARGGFRSRGPVLWAMHVIKLERFTERHFGCREYGTRKQGGPLLRPLPDYLVWALRFGDSDYIQTQIERARRAGISDVRLYEVVPEQEAKIADLVPF